MDSLAGNRRVSSDDVKSGDEKGAARSHDFRPEFSDYSRSVAQTHRTHLGQRTVTLHLLRLALRTPM
jgi:hypothetical protein